LQADERDLISQEAYLALCAEQGIGDPADALQLSDYLHHIGDILHFQDDPVLRDLVILRPTWGLDAVYRVLDNAEIVDNWGRFSLAQLRDLWHEPKYAGHYHHLLRLMRNFQLCYPLPACPTSRTAISPRSCSSRKFPITNGKRPTIYNCATATRSLCRAAFSAGLSSNCTI
jgi:internalin A